VDAVATDRARAAGFTDFVPKYDRDALTDSLKAVLSVGVAA
jgi:hypothetical protein